jgi:diguanylate cyclase (GGDEF)-like protein/PAS domain S-box-containing protein
MTTQTDLEREVERLRQRVAELERQLAALNASDRMEAQYRRLAANVPGMVYQFVRRPDGSSYFPFASDGCREFFGLEPDDLRTDAQVLIRLIHPDDMLDFQMSVDQSARSLRPWRWEGRFILPTGEEKWIQGASRPELQPNGDILWDGLLMDITDRRRAEEALQQRIFEVAHLHEQIRELGIRDGLTGLFKGRYLEGQLAHLFADHDSHSTLAVAMLDIDYLKEINDKYSRQIGDVALQTAARICQSQLDRSDMAGRYGGGEFMLVLQSPNRPAAGERCEAIRRAIELHPWATLRRHLRVTVSIGLAFADSYKNYQQVIRAADDLMYAAKRRGRNRVMIERSG